MIFIKVLLITLILRNIIPCEQFMRITGSVIVCTQHLCCIRFSEPAGSADTGQLLLCSYRSIDKADHSSLIHIIRPEYFCKSTVTRVQIGTHFSELLSCIISDHQLYYTTYTISKQLANMFLYTQHTRFMSISSD